MKILIIALLICVSACTSQKSIIATLLDNTSLKGDLKLNTTEGIDFGYKATLNLKNKYVSLELANLITKFKAKYNNDTNEFNYDGDLLLTHDGHNANASVKGALGYDDQSSSDTDQSNVTRAHISRNVRHRNNWKVQADEASAEGDHHGGLNATLRLVQKGNTIVLHEDISAGGLVNGSTSFNDSNVGNFTYNRAGLLGLDEAVIINPPDRKKQGPNSTVVGKLGFLDSGNFTWNNETSGVNRRGQAAFTGENFVNFSKHENLSFSRVVSAEAGLFQYQNEVFRNGIKLGDTFIKGKAGYAQAVNSLGYDNGTIDIAAANYGGADEQWIAFPKRIKRESRRYIMMPEFGTAESYEEESGEDLNSGKPSSGIISGKWKGGIHYRSENNNDLGRRGVNLQSGLFYNISGTDTIIKKPWVIQGNRTADTHWNIAPNGTQIDGIKVNTDTNNKFLRKILKSNADLEDFLHEN